MICPSCNGRGTRVRRGVSLTSPMPEHICGPCPDCGGCGVVSCCDPQIDTLNRDPAARDPIDGAGVA